jgi:hypothetical protein
MSSFFSCRGILLCLSCPYTSQHMAKLSVCFAPSTAPTAPSSLLPCRWLTGPRRLLHPLMCLTGALPLLSATKCRTSFFIALYLSTPTFACLVVCVTLTLVPQLPTNSCLVSHLACFLGIPLPTTVVDASISLRGVWSSHDMSCSSSQCFHSLPHHMARLDFMLQDASSVVSIAPPSGVE